MSASVTASSSQPNSFEKLRYGREIILTEMRGLQAVAENLDQSFCDAVDLILACRGSLVVIGMGKAGLVGQKLSASFASTGTPSHCLHPAEAVHGDLGMLRPDDIALVFSYSGESDEVVRILPSLQHLTSGVIAVTGRPQSSLARNANVTLDLGALSEACDLGLAPSTSTTAMMALGDALVLTISRLRGFRPEDFARFHPAGSLGRKLANVTDAMRPLEECRVDSQDKSIRQVFIDVGRPGRRSGAVMLTDTDGKLTGLFTDSDLARLLEQRKYESLDQAIQFSMTGAPKSIPSDAKMSEAISLMTANKISELPVIDPNGRPIGMIDITDVVDVPAIPKTVDLTTGQHAAQNTGSSGNPDSARDSSLESDGGSELSIVRFPSGE